MPTGTFHRARPTILQLLRILCIYAPHEQHQQRGGGEAKRDRSPCLPNQQASLIEREIGSLHTKSAALCSAREGQPFGGTCAPPTDSKFCVRITLLCFGEDADCTPDGAAAVGGDCMKYPNIEGFRTGQQVKIIGDSLLFHGLTGKITEIEAKEGIYFFMVEFWNQQKRMAARFRSTDLEASGESITEIEEYITLVIHVPAHTFAWLKAEAKQSHGTVSPETIASNMVVQAVENEQNQSVQQEQPDQV